MILWVIAQNTFRETVRNRVLLNILIFAVGLILLSLVIGDWSMGHQGKVIKDLGLSSMSIFGLLIAIFIGIRLMIQELEQKTIFILASKPIERWQIVVGKYFGLSLTLLIHVLIMAVTLMVLTFFMEVRIPLEMLPAILLIYLEILLIVAFALFFASFTSPTLAAIFTLLIYVMGHLSNFLRDYVQVYPDKGLHWLYKLIYHLLPNLEKLNLKLAVVHQLPSVQDFVLWSSFYALAYITIILLFTCLIYEKRDFK